MYIFSFILNDLKLIFGIKIFTLITVPTDIKLISRTQEMDLMIGQPTGKGKSRLGQQPFVGRERVL